MDIQRRTNETDLEYHKRLIYGKLIDKTLADYDFSEIAERIYGQAYSSDVARRMMYGSRKTLEAVESDRQDCIQDRAIVAEIDSMRLELQKERQRYHDQRREYNKLVNSDGRVEHLYDRLTAAADALSETVGNIYDDKQKTCVSGASSNEAVLVLSDWHYGLKTKNIFNDYDTSVCKQRVCHVVEQAIERIQRHKCETLHIVLLGDLYHGAIHVGTRVAAEELVCDQIMQVSEILAQSILELSRFVNKVAVHYTYGNHGRTVPNKKESIHRDNIERLIPWWLEQRFKDRDDIIIAPESDNEMLLLNVAGHSICACHGDLDNVRSSPKMFSTLLNQRYGNYIEYILLGDKHHRESFEEMGVTATVCGSLCGTDDYANGKRLYSTPSQLMLIVNEDIGIDAEYTLRCM